MKPKLSPPPAPTIVDVPDPDFEPGDKVMVPGGKKSFVFKARRRNIKTGEEWLDVVDRRTSHLRSAPPGTFQPDTRKV